MILVVLGTSSWRFDRLIKAVDELAQVSGDDVIIVGKLVSEYKPRYARYLGFINKQELEKLYASADVIIGHAGTGTILSSLRHKKPIIIVPRQSKFGEHFDDHQIQLAKTFENTPNVYPIYDTSRLIDVVREVKKKGFIEHKESPKKQSLIEKLKKYLSSLEVEG